MANKNAIQRVLERGHRRLEARLGATIVYREATLPCVPSHERRGMLVDVGGNPLAVEFSISIRRELFLTGDSTEVTGDSTEWTGDSDLPSPCSGQKGRDIFTYLGRVYRVLTVARSPDGSHFLIDFGDPDSGQ
jgi:hypothetical protein